MPNPWIQRYKEKAEANLSVAQSLCKSEFSTAINRAYYALYQAANAWMKLKGYAGSDRDRANWRHEEVSSNWDKILRQIENLNPGLIDHDGPVLYRKILEYRVLVDYKAAPPPSAKEAATIVGDAARATGWVFAALRKEGY